LLPSWEYVIIFLILGLFIFKSKTAKTVIFALAFGMLFHLIYDTSANEGMKFSSYSIIYRAENNFDIERLVTPEHWKEHLQGKQLVKFE